MHKIIPVSDIMKSAQIRHQLLSHINCLKSSLGGHRAIITMAIINAVKAVTQP